MISSEILVHDSSRIKGKHVRKLLHRLDIGGAHTSINPAKSRRYTILAEMVST